MATAPLILLTGATGFVGRQLLRALSERGCRVLPVVREGKQGEVARGDAIETIVASPDIFAEDADWWARACRGVDTVIHAAWYAEPGQYLQSPKNKECLSGTLRLADGAVQAKVRRFVGIGTCFEYDLDAGRLSIETPLRPATPYAQAKVDAFKALSATLPRQGVAFAWCRLFYLYGEGEDSRRLVAYVRGRLQAGEPVELSSGSQIRDFLDVREAARMIADVALGSGEGPVNICSGKPVTVREVAERIAEEFGRRDLLRFGARPDNPVDPPCVVGIRG
ncbi:MAG TPA: NAD(P)-dependent oxidoreductase [Pseudolabrys sp.]|jgi:dTDP-6-deoxy-L-talose 4-dehydrogenase (NAD+)|nr:NAD(P)-dependent oxidoreductase [Pseudolabrys sp.]